ncbi:Gfo/Idh/MocA family oxidoreductase [Aliiglaciecola sp. 3_MG-2023]|uniref:Gfo/Idh/MocA family protein n=1 Tax=Aliiglaciecola sp. 3_MG-2023 TaxID=3062644 RepID=UPI0026E228C0|nr:Gfo/Idh/MocA family oxidoreductase [Aliiglaciecola sp. 3_MG-2023]MDO6694573.1 Gfo/Idh/MocA family oxidoreductase [Aliiglaciecola sp. 3_MG-2023]
MSSKKVRMGMVGGGKGAFIGAIHRAAANLDGEIELVCGAFSSDPANGQETGQMLSIPSERCYADFNTMFTQEAKLPASQRMQFVSIVTPNHLHFPVAVAALQAGFHVMSDKPATFTLNEAIELKEIIEQSGCLYGLTHTYTGYPMVKEATARVANGELGEITKVVVEYSQGWLANKEDEAGKQASWRLDPKRAGVSCCMGDIGVHAANLAETISGLEIVKLCADLEPVVDGRVLDDDGTVLLRFNNGAKGVLLSSQIAVGEENNLNIRIYGKKASLQWQQMEPNTLWMRFNDKPSQMIRAGVGECAAATAQSMRTPAGHPEGYIEAFANLYCQFAQQIRDFDKSKNTDISLQAPGIEAAIRGMAFIENTVAASRSEQKWHPFLLSNIKL